MNRVLWILQVLLAALFCFAGAAKFVMPAEAMTQQMPVAMSIEFIRFIGVCELLGAMGLILPGVLNIETTLTPLAAAGLVVIMVGATVVTLMGGKTAAALFPAAVGILASFVFYGRWRQVPLGSPRPIHA